MIPLDQRQNLMYRATLADQSTLESEAVLSEDGLQVELKRYGSTETPKEILLVDNKEGVSVAKLWLTYEEDDPDALAEVIRFAACGSVMVDLKGIASRMRTFLHVWLRNFRACPASARCANSSQARSEFCRYQDKRSRSWIV